MLANFFLFCFGMRALWSWCQNAARPGQDCTRIQLINITTAHTRRKANQKFGDNYRNPSTLLFCRGRQRNVRRIITHIHSHCIAHQRDFFCGAVAVAVVAFLSFLVIPNKHSTQIREIPLDNDYDLSPAMIKVDGGGFHACGFLLVVSGWMK